MPSSCSQRRVTASLSVSPGIWQRPETLWVLTTDSDEEKEVTGRRLEDRGWGATDHRTTQRTETTPLTCSEGLSAPNDDNSVKDKKHLYCIHFKARQPITQFVIH